MIMLTNDDDVTCIRPKKKIPVFPLTCQKKLGSVGQKIFLVFVLFLFVRKRSKMFNGAKYHQQSLKTDT